MRRVLIIGSGGAGKTTLAGRIAARTGLPLVHLDALYWRAGWVPTPRGDWERTVTEIVAGDRWICDGNYSGTMALRLAVCDTVIYLDIPRHVCIWRLLKRRVRYGGRVRPDLPACCPERITWAFMWWVWSYASRRRPQLLRQLAAIEDRVRVVVLTDNDGIEAFMADLPRAAAAKRTR